MTLEALTLFGAGSRGGGVLRSPGKITVEGDWSNAAFFLGAKSLGSGITVNGLNPDSTQGDRKIAALLTELDRFQIIDGSNIPDLIPILAVTAAGKQGALFTNISRLRMKESDRVASVLAMLGALGIRAEATDTTLHVHPGTFTGGTVDACRDHRIAMSAAVAATVASGPVTVLGAECVEKSYPAFWAEYKRLGGRYEFLLR